MQKWDYISIVVDYENIHDLQGRPRYVNGHELPDRQKGENIFGVINQLRWKGWDPVSFGPGYPVKRQIRPIPLLFRRLRSQ